MSRSLRDELKARIRDRGPITFAEFMEVALYDPVGGFFSGAPVRREFVTSVHVSPLFGALIARALAACFEALDKPRRFTVVDLGAGDGALARSLVAIRDAKVVAVERSRTARAKLRGLRTAAAIEDLKPFTGAVIANELFDNVPFHRVRMEGGRAQEVFVDLVDDRFVETFGEPTVDAEGLRDGEERTISSASEEIVSAIAKVLERGYVFVIDYGNVAGEANEPVRGYRAHQMIDDLVSDPGANDITGPVDFDALASAARRAGLQVHGPITQREFLMNLGYREALDRMRAQQQEAEAQGAWRRAIEDFGARGDATMLVDPDGLGSLKVLALSTPGLPRLSALQSRG